MQNYKNTGHLSCKILTMSNSCFRNEISLSCGNDFIPDREYSVLFCKTNILPKHV